jgi:hypothetical protein
MQTPSEKIQLMLRDVKTIIERKGNYPVILVGIRAIEKISKQEGLKVPNEIPDLRKKAYAIQASGLIESARYHIEKLKQPYCAKDILKSAEAYARIAGLSVPKEIYELRELITEK